MRRHGKNRLLWLILLTTLTALACNAPVNALFAPAIPMVTPDPNAAATPTPFVPLAADRVAYSAGVESGTPLPSLDAHLVTGEYPEPSEPSAIEIPAPIEAIDFSPDAINIILMGSDYRAYMGGHRTDTLMIVSLDPRAGTVKLLSIPRDLYIYLPGWRVNRINTADQKGGPEMLAMAIRYNFGIPIHHWARVNFDGFTQAIDTLGGIEIDVPKAITDQCEDDQPLKSFEEGPQHMDGDDALCYVRMRKRSSDFDRLRRQQEVVQAIFNTVLSLNGLSRAPELYEQFQQYVETDMPLEEILGLIPLATRLATDPSRIERYQLDPTIAKSWRVPYSGASVLLLDRENLSMLLDEAFGP